MAINVLVIEDEPNLNADLVFYLNAMRMQVDGAASAAEMRTQLQQNRYDVVVLDLGLPDADGLQLATELSAEPQRGLVILTARGRLEERLAGWRSGAHVYLVKPVPLAEVAAVIGAVFQHLQPDEIVTTQTAWQLSLQPRELHTPQGVVIPLTHRESLLFMAFIHDAEHYVSRDLSMAQDTGTSIDSLVHRLRRKLRHHADPIRTIYGGGYKFEAALQLIDIGFKA
ncbi:MAG: response regulator transcription factor [Thiotrichaceae bacterium]|nr:response regulator transcription factor [Thiotrichaceae bacterium]